MKFIFVIFFTDASSSNEAVHLQQRLKSLSSELVTLRNRLHRPTDVTAIDGSLDSAGGRNIAIANLLPSAANRIASNGKLSSLAQLMSGSQTKPLLDSNNEINSKVCCGSKFEIYKANLINTENV